MDVVFYSITGVMKKFPISLSIFLSITYLTIGSIIAALSKNISIRACHWYAHHPSDWVHLVPPLTCDHPSECTIPQVQWCPFDGSRYSLADIYDPHQRGTMVGIYYSAPLLAHQSGGWSPH